MKAIPGLDRKGRRALRVLIAFFLIALFADLIANERPLLASYKDELYSPILRSYGTDLGITEGLPEPWEADDERGGPSWELKPPVPYSPGATDPRTEGAEGPFEEQSVEGLRDRHWLGTDELGRDLLAGLVHGTRNALLIGLGATLLASLLGVLAGSLAGYFGDHRFRISRATGLISIPILFLAAFYAFYARGYALEAAWEASSAHFLVQGTISLGICLLSILLIKGLAFPLKQVPGLSRTFPLPLDQLIMRSVDGLLSIPALFLILAIMAIFRTPSLFLLILVIGILGWCSIARITRAELLRVRELPFIEAARSVGVPEHRVLLRHALPNVMTPILVAMSYGIAGAILTGSALSFLGLVPGDMTFWGGILAKARDDVSAWWTAVFPGTAIALLVGAFNVLGESLRKKRQD
jgi:peptide/nickel transport system permease protein